CRKAHGRGGARAPPRPHRRSAPVLVLLVHDRALGVDLEALPAHVPAHGLVLADPLLVHAHPLDGPGPLADDRALLVQGDGLLVILELAAAQGHTLADRLALDHDLVVLQRDLLLDLLGLHVLAQPYVAGLPGLLADAHPLLGAGHVEVVPRLRVAGRALGGDAGRPQSVVAVETGLLLQGQAVVVHVDVRRVLDRLLAERDAELVTGPAGTDQRHEGLLHTEHPGAHRDPLRLARAVAQEDLADLADMPAVRVDDVAADQAPYLCLHSHRGSPEHWLPPAASPGRRLAPPGTHPQPL